MGGMIHTTQECRIGDAYKLLCEMPDESNDTIITSPPYWGLRDYGVDGQIGLEPTLTEYHARLLEVTAECMRVLKPTGVMFWNHGDSYGGYGCGKDDHRNNDERSLLNPDLYNDKAILGHKMPAKCMIMQNERLIMRMIDEQGWILRNRIIWNKPNGMPSSVTDRFSNKYEPVYMLVKSKKYWFDLDAARVPHKETSLQRQQRATSGKYREESTKAFPDKNPHNLNRPRPNVKGLRTAMEALDEGTGLHPLGKNPGDVWTIPTQPYSEAHFATFPTALIEPMIKVACPAEICPVCGLARERIVDREFVLQRDVSEDKGVRGANDQKPMDASNKWQGVPRGTTAHHTAGWTLCDCNAGWIAGTVLDPFCGSGTVLEVCRLLNRNAIGFELNPEYEPLIRERSMSHTPPLTAYEVN